MRDQPHGWLPDCAFTGPATLAPIAASAAEWSVDWLPRDRLEPDVTWSPGGIASEVALHASRPGFALLARREERLRLASLLLGRPIEPRHLRTDHDRALVDRLVDRATDDLAERIARSLPQPSGRTSPQPDFEFSAALRLSNGGRELLRIATHRRFLVELAKHDVPPPRSRDALDPRSSAIASQSVDLSSLIGRASLTFHELAGLEVGDVITLNDKVDARRDLFVAGRRCVGDCVAIAANDDRLALIIEKAANAW